MSPSDFSDAALVLLGHGTTLNADSAAPVFQHCAELRRRKCFADVREAFWKQDPQIKDVLANLTAPRVFLVPLFISEGHFSEEVIPRELGFQKNELGEVSRVQQRPPVILPLLFRRGEGRGEGPFSSRGSRTEDLNTQTLFYCHPVGSHDSMTAVLLARARDIVQKFPFPRAPKPADTTLFIAGHGTEQNENSRKAIDRQVELIRTRKLYADVQSVFLDEEPRIAQCYQLARTRNVVMVPFFISDGLHVREDIPVLLGEPQRVVQQRLQNGQPTWRNPTERKDKLLWYSSSVGTDPRLADVILARAREAASSH